MEETLLPNKEEEAKNKRFVEEMEKHFGLLRDRGYFNEVETGWYRLAKFLRIYVKEDDPEKKRTSLIKRAKERLIPSTGSIELENTSDTEGTSGKGTLKHHFSKLFHLHDVRQFVLATGIPPNQLEPTPEEIESFRKYSRLSSKKQDEKPKDEEHARETDVDPLNHSNNKWYTGKQKIYEPLFLKEILGKIESLHDCDHAFQSFPEKYRQRIDPILKDPEVSEYRVSEFLGKGDSFEPGCVLEPYFNGKNLLYEAIEEALETKPGFRYNRILRVPPNLIETLEQIDAVAPIATNKDRGGRMNTSYSNQRAIQFAALKGCHPFTFGHMVRCLKKYPDRARFFIAPAASDLQYLILEKDNGDQTICTEYYEYKSEENSKLIVQPNLVFVQRIFNQDNDVNPLTILFKILEKDFKKASRTNYHVTLDVFKGIFEDVRRDHRERFETIQSLLDSQHDQLREIWEKNLKEKEAYLDPLYQS